MLNGKWPRSFWIAWERDRSVVVGSGGVRYEKELVRWENATIIDVSSMTISSVENIRANVDYVNEDGSSYLITAENDRFDYSGIMFPPNTNLLEFEVSSRDAAVIRLSKDGESSAKDYRVRFERSQILINRGNNVTKSKVFLLFIN